MDNIFKKKKIRSSRTVGKLLKTARKKIGFNLEKIEANTKIRLRYLEALEKDDFENMAADVYNIGFLSRYSNFLKLDSEKIITKYQNERKIFNKLQKKRSLFNFKEKTILNPGNPEKYRDRLKFVFTPQRIISLLIVITVLSVLGYIWFQVKTFAASPRLEISNPNQQIVISMDTIKIVGETNPDATLIINDREVAIESSGNFDQEVQLTTGINNIQIKAINKAGKETVKMVQVLATDQK